MAPVPVGGAAMLSADLSTQDTVIAGLLTCVYMLVKIVLIVRRERIEYEKHEMAKREPLARWPTWPQAVSARSSHELGAAPWIAGRRDNYQCKLYLTNFMYDHA